MRSIHHSAALALVAALSLGACGGGSGTIGETVVTTPPVDPLSVVPAITASSADAVVGYLLNLETKNAQAETREAIDLGTMSLAQSDTTEPTTIP